jgi:site-specific recombinase XerD
MTQALIPVPLEQLAIPTHMNGTDGSNRAPLSNAKQIAADDDLQAIETWLAEYDASEHTQRHYRKEAERLMLWALIERGKALSSLSREDCLAYEKFLANPTPAERWVGPKQMPRFSEQWRPFNGSLTPASVSTSLRVVNSLFSYLVRAGYLAGNPLSLLRRRAQRAPERKQVERFLEHNQWLYLMGSIESLPQESIKDKRAYERARFLLSFLYLLGPRVHELAKHDMTSFINVRGLWWWEVTGKGGKTARVPVNEDMMKALQRYRKFLGLSPYPTPKDRHPIALSLSGKSGISDNMIYRIIKGLVQRAADMLEEQDAWSAEKLRAASTHWLRHTAITHQADAGISLLHLQKSARHSKLETTSLYLHTEDTAWHEAMQGHKMNTPNTTREHTPDVAAAPSVATQDKPKKRVTPSTEKPRIRLKP